MSSASAPAIDRSDAIALIVDAELQTLSERERASMLLDWWTLDASDAAFDELPASLRAEMRANAAPGPASTPHHDALIRMAAMHRWVGVRNEYLASRLVALGHAPVVVTGAVEPLEACLCCGYRTLVVRAFSVCPACFWEDDGSTDPQRISPANHMTLAEARANFARLGAISDAHVGHVVPDASARYRRD